MIKYSKILALFAALTFAFALAGCGEDAPETSGIGRAKVQTTLLDLKAELAKTSVGDKDLVLAAKLFDDEITSAAGTAPTDVSFEVITGKLLQVTAVKNWGGFDINYNASLGGLKAGDVIYIKGKAGPAGAQVLLNTNHSGWGPLQNWNPVLQADEEFEKTFTLEASDVALVLTASPQAIRVRAANAGEVFIVEELKVTGLR